MLTRPDPDHLDFLLAVAERDSADIAPSGARLLAAEVVALRGERDEALAQVETLVEAATGLYERVEMDESVGICLSTRAESLTLGDALAPFKDTP